MFLNRNVKELIEKFQWHLVLYRLPLWAASAWNNKQGWRKLFQRSEWAILRKLLTLCYFCARTGQRMSMAIFVRRVLPVCETLI
jgi:hypothetical protein